jgi:hypothetical protein
VSDQEHGAPVPQTLDRLGDDVGANRVEVGRRLVEYHERRVAQKCAS